MTKIRHLEPYGFNEQPQFDGLVNTVKANIENIKEKNEEQDKKDVEQDANITQVTSTLTDSLNQKLGSGFTGDNSANTVTSVIENNERVTASALNDLNDRKADASALTAHISDSVKHITTDERTKWNGKISNAEYNGTEKKIYFYSGATKENPVANIDATNFIKDGMVSKVEIKDVTNSGSCLVITFNTDAKEEGKEDIVIPVSEVFNPTNYYLKTETSGKTEISTALNEKANQSDLTAHTGNNDIHVTSDDKTKWNNAFENNHTHANKNLLDTITTIDSELNENSKNLVVNSAITKVILENEKIVSTSLNDLNDRKLDSSAYTPTDLSDYYKKEETSGKTELTAAFNSKANSADLTTHTGNGTIHITDNERTKWNGKLSNVQYNKADKKIYFYSGATTETPVLNIDATDFIKDGMVSNVEIKDVTGSGSCLVITFNGDSGKQAINIPISTIFNASNYYLKAETSGSTEISDALSLKADASALTAHTGNNDIHITAAERTKWDNAATSSHTHDNKAVLDKITAIDTELSKTSDNLVVNSAITKVIVDNEKIVSASLNDLNDRKLDASAYTKTDLSDYYKKEETSGKTELDAALTKKANTSDLDAKANTGHTHTSNDITDKVTAITDSNSTSASVPTVNAVMQKLNELNNKITQLQTTVQGYESRIATLEGKNSNNASQG